MSSDTQLILEAVPLGNGLCLDLGGSRGALRNALEQRGYHYINLDIHGFGNGEPSLIGDAHRLPFKDGTLDMVVSKDTLEHFIEPWVVVKEVSRVLRVGGKFIICVPFMHPFHGDDFYRYSPIGLRYLLGDFDLVSFETPLWLFTVIGVAMVAGLRRIHLGFAERPIRHLCGSLDRLFTRNHPQAISFAAAYRIVACRRDETKTIEMTSPTI